MILFGTKSVVRVVPGGVRVVRFCGKCQADAELVEHRSRPYFTLYFLPVFPIGVEETVLRCARCASTHYLTQADYAAKAQRRESHTLHCPYCEQALRVPDGGSGARTLRCGACRGEFSIERTGDDQE